MSRIPVAVVGGGQAGLVAGYFLKQAGVPFVILEADEALGRSWHDRWDSLELFTPARYSGLPGMPFPGQPWRYPAKEEVVTFLRSYVEAFELPVQFGQRVTALRPAAGGSFEVETSTGTYLADATIVATGGFQRPHVPPFATGLAADVVQLHSSEYRNPSQLADGTALVVGGGNSGLQIADELASGSAEPVHLSVGSKQTPMPRRFLGADLFWWLDHLGMMRVPQAKLPKWLAGDGDILVGQSIDKLVRARGVATHPRTVGSDGQVVTFADGTTLDAANLVWATGYRPDFSWVQAPVFQDGRPVQVRG
ncbi:MAG: flavin-containing monooxygenase, partial [Pseudonocardiaceae bacterium]